MVDVTGSQSVFVLFRYLTSRFVYSCPLPYVSDEKGVVARPVRFLLVQLVRWCPFGCGSSILEPTNGQVDSDDNG